MTDEDTFSDFIEKEKLDAVDQIVNRRKLVRQFPTLRKGDEEEDAFLRETLDAIELAAINLWNPEAKKAKEFRRICSKFVDIA